MDESKYITSLAQLARYTGFNRNTLRPKVVSGEIAGNKRGHQWTFLKADIDAWMMGGEISGTTNSTKDN